MTDHTEHGTRYSAAALMMMADEIKARYATDIKIARLARAWHAAIAVTAKARAAVPEGVDPFFGDVADESHPAIAAWADAARADAAARKALLAALREESRDAT